MATPLSMGLMGGFYGSTPNFSQFGRNADFLGSGLATAALNPYASFSGADIRALIIGRTVQSWDQTGKKVIDKPVMRELGEIHTLSWSEYREKRPVRALGCVSAKGYTRGPRTAAGSLIFTVFSAGVLSDLVQGGIGERDRALGGLAFNWQYISVDQIPPFDILIRGVNELGQGIWMGIYGVEIVASGGTLSVQDLVTENTAEYVCRHISPIRPMMDMVEDNRHLDRDFDVTDLISNTEDRSPTNIFDVVDFNRQTGKYQ